MSRAIDALIAYRLLKLLVIPFKKTKAYQEAKRQIHCVWDDWGKWYISPEGLVFQNF